MITVPKPLAIGTSGLIQSSFAPRGGHGNLEVVVQYDNRLIHFWHDETMPDWRSGQTISTNATGPASIIQSSFKSRDHGNFEVVVAEGNLLVHYFHDNSDVTSPWQRGQTISTRASGPASIVQSSFKSGDHGNFEVVAQEGNQIVHYFHDNANVTLPWRRGQTISTRATGPASIIQSSFKSRDHGNFEVVVQEGDELVHYFHDNSDVSLPWRRGQTISTRATGPASIIQSSFKSRDHGNFEVVVPEGSEIVHYFHDNSDVNLPWRRGQTISIRATGPASIIQSSFKSRDHGNFEVVVPEGNEIVHYFHDNSDVNLPWRRAPQVFAAATVARSEKICQVTGDWDFQLRGPSRTATASRFQLTGTDLGFPFEHNGRWFILFGDTRPRDLQFDDGRDSIAIVNGQDPDGCPQISFISDPFGGGARFRPLTVAGVSLAFFEVPTGGFTAFGHMYVFQWTDHRDLGNGKFTDPIGHTALTRSDDDGRTFRRIYEDLGDRFVYVTPAVVRRGSVAGLPPSNSGDGLLIWAAGAYRDSDPYLAYVPLVSEQALETKSSLWYFAGINAISGQPMWSQQELQAEPVFRSANPCIGEFSATWEPNLGQWLMLYNCDDPGGIIARRANNPWGPWSDVTVVFQHDVDGGLCTFMHAGLSGGCGGHLNDPASPVSGLSGPGGEYAPYVLPFLTQSNPSHVSIFYLMSTWNPYQVVLMKTTVRR